MKGYYLFAPVEPESAGPDSGIERKVRAQHRILSEFSDCGLMILPAAEFKGDIKEKLFRRLPLTAAWRKWKYTGEFDGADFLYIRQVYHDADFVRYLRAVKRRNPKIKIIYEVPTYPYDLETRISLSNFSFVLKERINRKRAARYFDRIVTFYNQEKIWGVPCITLINGFDFSKISLPSRVKQDTIEIISVSSTAFWHGYDRLIEGMHNYYENGGTENIVYHMVGNAMPVHKELAEKYKLQKHIVFHGKMFGEELEAIYKKCFIGIDVLGGHRKDYPVSSSLKSREYAAYGLPLVTSSPVDYLPRDYKYQLLAPYDDSPLNVSELLSFWHSIYDNRDCNAVAAQIRAYSEDLCDMKVTMKPIVEYIGQSKE